MASAAPQITLETTTKKPVVVLRDDRVEPHRGSFSYNLETDDGNQQDIVGQPGYSGATVIKGSYK